MAEDVGRILDQPLEANVEKEDMTNLEEDKILTQERTPGSDSVPLVDVDSLDDPDIVTGEISPGAQPQEQNSLNPEYMDDYVKYREEADSQEEEQQELGELQELEKGAVDKSVDEWEISPEAKEEEAQERDQDDTPVTPRRRGFTEKSVRAVVGGVAEGINEMVSLVNKTGTAINKAVGLDKIIPKMEADIKLPELKPEEEGKESGITENIIRTISKFAVGFKGVDKVLKGLKVAAATTKAGKVAERIGKFVGAEALVTDEQEERLSNIIESVPALQNPVTEYLQAKEDDSFAEAKMKQAIEAAALGGATEALFAGVKAMKVLLPLKNKAAQLTELAETEARDQEIFKKMFGKIGDIEREELVYNVKPTAEEVKAMGKRAPNVLDEVQINFTKIEGPEDIAKTMQAMANNKNLKSSVQEARRGVRTTEQTLKSAEDVSGFNELLSRRKGEAFNAEQTTAVRQVYYKTTDKLMEVAEIAARPDRTEVDVFNFRRMLSIHKMVQGEVLGARAEAGRALQAWSIPMRGGTVDINSINNTLAFYGGTRDSAELAIKVASLGKEMNTTQLNAISSKGAWAATGDALLESWRLGLVSNPAIHVTNIVEGMMTAAAEIPKRAMASMMKDSGVASIEPLYLMYGYLNSFKGALANSAKAFKSGRSGYSTGKLELRPSRATAKETLENNGVMTPFAYAFDYYGRAVEVAGRALAAGDEFARSVLAEGQKYSLAARDASAKGLKGKEFREHVGQLVAMPTEEMQLSAREFAEYNIFMQDFGRFGQTFQTMINKVPPMRLIFPFVKVAGNIFKYNFEHTPLAVLSSRIRGQIQAGGTERATALAKIGMGSAMIATGTDLCSQGILTGQGPSDPNQQRLLRASGWQPYSIRVGDKYVGIQRFGALGDILMATADLTEILTNYEAYDMQAQDESESVATALIAAVSNQVIGRTSMQGMAETLHMLAEPKRRAERFLKKYIGSMVPTAIAGVARITDPTLREVTTLFDAFKNKIPGWSKTLPARKNVWGQDMSIYYPTIGGENAGFVGGAVSKVANWINPTFLSQVKDSPINQWMIQNGFPVSMPAKRQNFNGSMVDLNEYPEIYSRMLELRGQDIELMKYSGMNLHDYLDEVAHGFATRSMSFFSEFKDFDDQKNFISNIVSDYTKAAKKQLIDEFPVLEQIIMENQLEERKQAQMITPETPRATFQ